MHGFDEDIDELATAIFDYARWRIRLDPPPLDGPRSPAELTEAAGDTITPDGIGGGAALRIWADVLGPATISQDSPANVAFIPSAPTEAAVLFDLVVGASSIYAGSWLEGAGAVWAENEALRWLAGLAGLPETSGGCFVAGGTAGNLGALVTARHAARAQGLVPERWRVATTADAHSSIAHTARVMDVDLLTLPSDERGRLTGPTLAAGLDADGGAGVFAVVATAGTTNAGIVDDLAGTASVCRERGLWFHVDGAYGGAGLAAPSIRALYDGIEHADSLVIDPHKWLFSPYDCAALLYREPEIARAAHTQHAGYLEPITTRDEWNPSDYAFHLTRRARGLPFWFSLATHGTRAYEAAIERSLATVRDAAREIDRRPHLELLVEPELSVLLFRRIGWVSDDYRRWSDRLLAEQRAFCPPTVWRGETVARFAVTNPGTSLAHLVTMLDAMADEDAFRGTSS